MVAVTRSQTFARYDTVVVTPERDPLFIDGIPVGNLVVVPKIVKIECEQFDTGPVLEQFDIPYVLEQPPIIFALANILKQQHMYEEAINLVIVLQSPRTRFIVYKVFYDVIYRYNFDMTTRSRLIRFLRIATHLIRMSTLPLCRYSGKRRRSQAKTIIVLLDHFVSYKDIVLSNPKFLNVLELKIGAFIESPYIGEYMAYYLDEFGM